MAKFTRTDIDIEIPNSVKLHEDLIYSSIHQRNTLHFLRPAQTSAKLPLIIYIHGGAWHHGTKDLQIPHLLPYVESGKFAAAAINYRFSQHAPWPAQLDDCRNALNFLISKADEFHLDIDNISIWGSSSGAHLSLHLVNDPKVKSVLAYCPPSHFRPLLEILEYEEHELKSHVLPDSPVIQLIGQDPLDAPELLLDSSPYEHLSDQSCPILIAHGTDDEPVPYTQSLAYQQKAKSLELDCKLITLQGHGHKFTHPKLDLEALNFFNYHLHNDGYPPKDLTIT